jgi:hypothetical protein
MAALRRVMSPTRTPDEQRAPSGRALQTSAPTAKMNACAATSMADLPANTSRFSSSVKSLLKMLDAFRWLCYSVSSVLAVLRQEC